MLVISSNSYNTKMSIPAQDNFSDVLYFLDDIGEPNQCRINVDGGCGKKLSGPAPPRLKIFIRDTVKTF